jgi:hypothetical protein
LKRMSARRVLLNVSSIFQASLVLADLRVSGSEALRTINDAG